MSTLESTFHEGELQVQTRVGVREDVAPFAERAIRDHMPEQHREFYARQCMVMAGMVDGSGQPWGSPLFSEPGFVASPDSTTLEIQARPWIEKSGLVELSQGDKIGLLGIELATRRRNRINGVVSDSGQQRFAVTVDQSFGNCPKYIQKRELLFDTEEHARSERTDTTLETIDAGDQLIATMLSKCDTFFIASRSASLTEDANSGVDVSHRGGRPGFIKPLGDNRMVFPDFAGNRFFNTLGNITSDPRVGLFIPNFSTGDMLWLSGQARINYDAADIAAFDGAQRLIELSYNSALLGQQAIVRSASSPEFSPQLEHTGVWSEVI